MKKVKLETIETEKKFSSYKARLHFNESGLSIDVPIRWKKLDTKELDNAYPVVYRTADGKPVRSFSVTSNGEDRWIIQPKGEGSDFLDPSKVSNIVTQNKKWCTADGCEVLEGIRAFQIVDSKEEEVQKLKKSEDFIVIAQKPAAEYDEWLEESLYSIWGEKPADCYGIGKFAKHLYEKDLMAVVKISVGNSFKEYYGMIKPCFTDDPKEGGSFTLTMKITRQRVKFFDQSKMIFTTKAPKIEEKEAKPKSKMDTI